MAPPAPAEGDKEPGHLRTRHSEVEPDSSGSGGGELPAEAGLDGHLGEQLHDDDEEDWEELPPRLAWMVTRFAATAPHHSLSHSSHWPHGDVGPLSKLVLGVHTSVWIEV